FGGTRLDWRITRLFHQRDGKGARRYHVGRGRARNHTGHETGDNGRLGRPTPKGAQTAVRQINEILTGTGLVQERAEQNEQKHEGGRNLDRRTPDALRRNVELLDNTVPGIAIVQKDDIRGRQRDDARRAGRRIQYDQTGDDRQRITDNPGGRHHQDGDHERAHPDVTLNRYTALNGYEIVVVQKDIQRGPDPQNGQNPVIPRNDVTRPVFARIGQKGQRKPECQMDGTHLLRVQCSRVT